MMNDQDLRRAVRQVALGDGAAELRVKNGSAVTCDAACDFSRIIGTGKSCQIGRRPPQNRSPAGDRIERSALRREPLRKWSLPRFGVDLNDRQNGDDERD